MEEKFWKKERILITFNKTTSNKDIEDLKALFEELEERYHFNWCVPFEPQEKVKDANR